MKRTWMKVSLTNVRVLFWVAIEGDTIKEVRGATGTKMELVGRRADDTLSQWGAAGWKIEGPFDVPE